MKKAMLGLLVGNALLFGTGEKVILNGWDKYPTPECREWAKGKSRYFLIPNGTRAEVIKWGNSFTLGSDRSLNAGGYFIEEVKLKITSGPLKGKECWVWYPYLHLKK